MGMAKPEAKTVSAAGEIDPRPIQPSVVATEAETRATNLPGEEERPSILITWLVYSKIVKYGKGDKEPTQGSMFSAGHEPTQDRAFGEGFESTQSSDFGMGHEPTQDSAFGEGRESTQNDPWDRRRGSAQPAGP